MGQKRVRCVSKPEAYSVLGNERIEFQVAARKLRIIQEKNTSASTSGLRAYHDMSESRISEAPPTTRNLELNRGSTLGHFRVHHIRLLSPPLQSIEHQTVLRTKSSPSDYGVPKTDEVSILKLNPR